MIERVAKAIYEKRNGSGCKPWSIQTKAHKEPYLADARAAVEAMREPTHKMEDAFYNEPHTNAGSKWRAMVDGALGHFRSP